MKRIKSVFLDWIKSFTAHGIPKIFKTNRTLTRILWIMFSLISTILCAIMLYESISSYYKRDVVTRIRQIYKTYMSFPTITICNTNIFTTNYSLVLIDQIMSRNPNVFSSRIIGTNLQPQVSKLKYFSISFANSFNLSDEERKKLGYSIEQFLLTCSFNQIDCNEKDFDWYYDLIYGNCYRFNSGFNSSIRKVAKTGKFYGLRLELYVGVPDDLQKFATSIGAHIFINHHKIRPKSSEGIDVASGTETNIVLKRTDTSHLKYPYSECRIEDHELDYYSETLSYKYDQDHFRYRRSDCMDRCFQSSLIDKCGCYDPVTGERFEDLIPCFKKRTGRLYGGFL